MSDDDSKIREYMEAIDVEVMRAMDLLPAWFVPRMMTDHWCFGLLLTTGDILGISEISAVHLDGSGALWIDVVMLEKHHGIFCSPFDRSVVDAPTSRLQSSVRADQIVAAFELADT